MSTAQFMYRCRKCGEVFGGPLTGAQRAQACLITATIGRSTASKSSFQAPAMIEIHDCTKGGNGDPLAGEGIADLIGYDLKDG